MSIENSLTNSNTTFVDLSIGLEPEASEPFPPEIEYFDHTKGAELLTHNLHELGHEDIEASDFPEEIGLAWEELTLITHAGTHMDAPWHYGPETDGEPSMTIDEVPLEWCAGNAVVFDFRWKEPRTEITRDELEEQLTDLDHELSPGEIVLIQTGADELWGSPEYTLDFPGMGAEATRYLVNQGVKVIGTNAYGFDKPFAEMGRRFLESRDGDELWPAHFVGRELEYCQIESMANLDALPSRTDVPLVTFPIEIENASGGWVRPVAIVEAEQ